MTWDEFKTKVDEELKGRQLDGTCQIAYIQFQPHGQNVYVFVEHSDGPQVQVWTNP